MSEIQEEYILVSSSEFLVLPNEDEEIFNEGTYGMALSFFLEEELNKLGYSGGALCEDWGWYLGLGNADKDPKASLEVGVYCPSGAHATVMKYVVIVSTRKTTWWNWKKLKKQSFAPLVMQLQKDIREILSKAPKTEIISITEDMPE